MKLKKDFYLQGDVVEIAQKLLGKKLVTSIEGQLTSGFITETEAYRGADDRASHAFGFRRTARTEVMFGNGGTAYVYLCYGIHHLFNIVTNEPGVPNAVLIRAVKPEEGKDVMLKRRNMVKISQRLSSGPGTLSQALGIQTHMTGIDLIGDSIWLEEGISVNPGKIKTTPRVGVDYAGEDAKLPWRFLVESLQ